MSAYRNIRKYIATLTLLIALTSLTPVCAEKTARIPEFSNDKTRVWKTIIYPSQKQTLSMHRHDYDRVVVAFNKGTLKITNDRGEVHYLKLQKNTAYYLPKDPHDELHQDENISKHPITVMVIELKE